MVNPFFHRASERYRDNEAFLSLVSPEPLLMHLEQPAKDGRLLDRLVIVSGTPGSGKTTMARMLELDVIDSLRFEGGPREHRDVALALARCGFVRNGAACVAAVRLPLESEYRQYWELPYASEVKAALLFRLLQARAVLKWVRLLSRVSDGTKPLVIARSDAEATLRAIGGDALDGLRVRASEVEAAIHGVGAALLPPSVDELPAAATSAYSPFDVIAGFRRGGDQEEVASLTPLVILDDLHELHPRQRARLKMDLLRREMPVGRWILTRLDAMEAEEALAVDASGDVLPGIDNARETTEIRFQQTGDEQRRGYNRLVQQMADRYLSRVPSFSSRGIKHFASILGTQPPTLPKKKLLKLRNSVDRTQDEHGVGRAQRSTIEDSVARYLTKPSIRGNDEGVALAMVSILMHRYTKRTRQRSLFEGDPKIDADTKLKVDSSVRRGAAMHLLHRQGRPLYYGFDALRDASWGNAEQFLHLAGRLVEVSEARLMRRKGAALTASQQHKEVVGSAVSIRDNWRFPFVGDVRAIADACAAECLAETLKPNAPLGAGAGAVGVLEAEMEGLQSRQPRLSRALHYGVAYNAFAVVRRYGQGGKLWCLIELGGVARVAYGLTLARGGFLERSVVDLGAMLPKEG